MTGGLVQMMSALAVVLGIVAVSAWLARRLGLAGTPAARLVKIVSSLSVGAKERVVVIEIDKQWMVLGVAPGRVNALATLPRRELPDASKPGPVQGIDFAALVKRTVGRA